MTRKRKVSVAFGNKPITMLPQEMARASLMKGKQVLGSSTLAFALVFWLWTFPQSATVQTFLYKTTGTIYKRMTGFPTKGLPAHPFVDLLCRCRFHGSAISQARTDRANQPSWSPGHHPADSTPLFCGGYL